MCAKKRQLVSSVYLARHRNLVTEFKRNYTSFWHVVDGVTYQVLYFFHY